MPLDEKSYFTVSEINAQIRTIIEESYADVTVLGEISNFKRHTSGHLYFTLKDAESQLRGVCFRSDAGRITFEPEDGMRVLASGRLTLYEPYGQYQLVAYSLEEAGAGELERAFRELCEKLEKEGLFDPEHKKPLPVYPFRIAVVTSPTGAAVRDIISTLRRRWPPAEILLFPVAVQGENAAPQISRALGLLGGVADLDLVILGRGGGSLEDLWAFNEEVVARAIYNSPIPVVSAVGHETDFTISDFVADVRAATPTMAAEIAVPQRDEILARLDERQSRLVKYAGVTVELKTRRLEELLRSYALGQVKGRVEGAMQALDFVMEKLVHRIVERVGERGNRLNEVMTRLEGLDAKRILSRGYTICTDVDTGRLVRSSKTALEAGEVHVTFVDGKVHADVKELADE